MTRTVRRLLPALALTVSAVALTGCAYDDYDGYYRPHAYGGYDGSYHRAHHRYRNDDYGYEDNYGYGSYRVCDPDGDRCYRSGSPHWSYLEYYRHRGYRWEDD